MNAYWLYEAGIGEARAALVDDGAIVVAAIEPEATLTVGTVALGRLVERLPDGRARVALDGGEAMLDAGPRDLTHGAAITVAITREAIPERGRLKPPRAVVSDAAPAPGPDLLARIAATALPIRRPAAHEPDVLEAAGWSEVLEEATGGDIAFVGGMLRMSATPAMTLFDVDGGGDSAALALAAAAAVGAAIRRHGIGGSIGVDFPTLGGKAARQSVAAALDTALAWPGAAPFGQAPYQRTGINGFGFLQLVRPRPRASLPERLGTDPLRAAACALLRRLERTPPGTPSVHDAPPAVIRYLEARPAWLAELARRTGVVHRLVPR